MRSDRLYLEDICEAADAITGFLRGVDRAQFLASELIRSAVLHKLAVIGEAAARVSAETREQNSNVPWADIVGFRNIAVHAYFSVDWVIVWNTAVADAPLLASQARDILAKFNQGDST